jgi:hypothetical protein
VANLSDKPLAAPSLDLAEGLLCSGAARAIYQTGTVDPGTVAVTAPAVDAAGGTHDWTPLATVPPRSVTIIELGG